MHSCNNNNTQSLLSYHKPVTVIRIIRVSPQAIMLPVLDRFLVFPMRLLNHNSHFHLYVSDYQSFTDVDRVSAVLLTHVTCLVSMSVCLSVCICIFNVRQLLVLVPC